jgi:hypothetical protein
MATVAKLRASPGLRATRQRIAALSAVLLAAVLLTAAPAAAQGGDDPALDPSSPDPAADFLMDKYQLSEDEALRRLDLQERVTTLLDDYAAALGEDYGGLWIDQAGGGIAMVGALPGQEDLVREIAAARGVEPVVVRVGRSIAQLRTVQEQLLSTVPGNSGLEVGGVYVQTNQVNLLVKDEPQGSAQDQARSALMSQLAQDHLGAVRFGTAEGEIVTAACVHTSGSFSSLGKTWCDPPLRGGVGISAANAVYQSGPVRCTAGFNVRRLLDGGRYLLTAGHCAGGPVFQSRFADNSIQNIGFFKSWVWDSRGDAMIIGLANPSGWNPKPWVFRTAGSDTTQSAAYTIRRSATTSIGMAVCMTGRRDGTECGEVIDNDRPGDRVRHVAEVRGGCMRGGDSGGPVYRSHTAYGIVHGGRHRDDNNNYCSTTWLYQGVRGAMNLLGVRLVTVSNP